MTSYGKEMACNAVISLGGEPLARHLAVGLVLRDALANPVRIHLAPLRIDTVRGDGNAEYVVESKRPIINELRRAN